MNNILMIQDIGNGRPHPLLQLKFRPQKIKYGVLHEQHLNDPRYWKWKAPSSFTIKISAVKNKIYMHQFVYLHQFVFRI
jgi:hypothetical protein